MLWKCQNLTQGSKNSSRGKIVAPVTKIHCHKPDENDNHPSPSSAYGSMLSYYHPITSWWSATSLPLSHSPDHPWLFMLPLRLFNIGLSGSFTEVIVFRSHEMEFFVEIIFSCKYHYLCHKFVRNICRLKLLDRYVFAVSVHDKVH